LTQPKEQKFFASFFQKRRFFLIFYFMAIAITVAPFLAMRVPGLGDTLNHLARMHILLDIDRSPDLQRFYVVKWSPVPYLAMDAVVPLLAHFLPLFATARVFVGISVLMPFLGAATLHEVVHRRLSLVPAAALLLGANYLVALGFLNYVFMAGLAVMLFAAWIATAGWSRLARSALFTPLATVLYFGHAFAFLGYGCAVAGAEIVSAWHTKFRPRPRVLLNLIAAGVQAIPALYFAAILNTAAGAPGQLYSHYGDPAEKLMALASPLLFLVDPVQVLVLLVCVALVLSGAGRLRLPKRVWPATVAVGVAALAAPEILLSTWLTDFRLPLFVMMLVLGGLTLTPAPRWRRPLAVALAIVLALKSFDIWRVLRITDQQIAQMRQVLTALPRGSRLLVANESGASSGQASLSGSTIWTMPLLAVIDRDAFVPYLFTGLTTVHMQPAYAASSTPQGAPVTLQYLNEDLAGQAPTLSDVEQREGLRIYWHDWPTKFDYLLVEHFFAMPPANVPKNLVMVAQGRDLELFRIRK
jgi:hypothetical protein